MPELASAELNQAAIDRKRLAEMHREMADPPAPGPDQDKPEGIENLCPFGCTNEELNDIGHCKHLIGFTSNGKTFEPQIKRKRPAREADGRLVRDEEGKLQYEWDGAWITDGRNIQAVLSTDVVKNGGKHTRAGVSARVYRQTADIFNS